MTRAALVTHAAIFNDLGSSSISKHATGLYIPLDPPLLSFFFLQLRCFVVDSRSVDQFKQSQRYIAPKCVISKAKCHTQMCDTTMAYTTPKCVVMGICKTWDLFGADYFPKQKPSARWMKMMKGAATDSDLIPVEGRVPPLIDNFAHKLTSGGDYIPMLIASTTDACIELKDNCCERCRRENIHSPFTGCYIVCGMFEGSCMNCAWGNYYDCCSLVNRPPPYANATAPAQQPSPAMQHTPVNHHLRYDQNMSTEHTFIINITTDPSHPRQEQFNAIRFQLQTMINNWDRISMSTEDIT